MSVGTLLEKPQPKEQDKESTSPPETEPSYFVDLATPIRDARDAYTEGMRTTLEKAIEVGRLLTEAKVEVKGKRDSWTVFVEDYCYFKIRIAQYYMRCYREQDYLKKTQSVAFLSRANLSTAIELLEKNSKNDKEDEDDHDNDHDNDTDDDTDNHTDDDTKDDGNKDESDKVLRRKARSVTRATSVVLRLIKGLEKAHGEDIWTRDELKDAVGHLTKLEEKLAEITDFAGIVDAE